MNDLKEKKGERQRQRWGIERELKIVTEGHRDRERHGRRVTERETYREREKKR